MAPDPAASVARAGPPALGVLTWNVYVGADLGRLLVVEDPSDIPPRSRPARRLDRSPHPVILSGDLNSDDDGSTTETYADVRSAGFVDSWLVGPPRGSGFTSGQDIFDPMPGLYHRIDYVFYRDEFTEAKGRFQGSIHAYRVGEDPADRTPGGIWPSDHAGVVAELTIAPGRGHPR